MDFLLLLPRGLRVFAVWERSREMGRDYVCTPTDANHLLHLFVLTKADFSGLRPVPIFLLSTW